MTKKKIAQKINSADDKALKKLMLRAEEIKKRGLNDEDIILQLIADEFNGDYKTSGILGAGMYDKMNYMCLKCLMFYSHR